MIGMLSGKPVYASGTLLILDVGGVGYRIHLLPESLQKLKREPSVALWTHLAVRENALDLYGFETKDELDFFELLVSISGVGPKSALAVLSIADVATLRGAVAAGDDSYLTRVSGIGKKSAERIILELKDKLGGVKAGGGAEAHADDVEVFEALTALGYSLKEARAALKQVPKEASGVNERLKAALRQLGNG